MRQSTREDELGPRGTEGGDLGAAGVARPEPAGRRAITSRRPADLPAVSTWADCTRAGNGAIDLIAPASTGAGVVASRAGSPGGRRQASLRGSLAVTLAAVPESTGASI